MRIRKATIEDKSAVLKLMSDFFNKTDYLDIVGYSRESLEGMFEKLVTLDEACLFITEDYSGCIGGYVMPYWMNMNKVFAQELFWWVAEDKRGGSSSIRLLDTFEEWSIQKKADAVVMSSTTSLNPEGVGAVYKRRGFVPIDISYIKRIKTNGN
jgi:hypothetical protein